MTPDNAQHWINLGFQAFAAPAKLNLFLHITGRREDGYHQLQSVFRLIDLHDTVYLKPTHDGQIRQLTPLPNTSPQQDLCLRAAQLLKAQSGCDYGVDIALDKRIPMGAGMGGGSSDAASILIALNQLWHCGYTRQQLMQLGLQLGADVPFFVFGQNAWVEGIGEQLQAITLQPARYLILTPQIHVSTGQIFNAEELTRNTNPTTIAAFFEAANLLDSESKQHQASKDDFHNDLEAVVCHRYPAVKACLQWLSKYGQAKMSGSGASVFIEWPQLALTHDQYMRQLEIPAELAGVSVFSCWALGLAQHPLYNLSA
jgi:4-diphosphocytidyl-2-C-methyl-D-erythritol kinase